MKPGKILDTDIAIKVLGLKITDFNSVPNFSTNVFDAYVIINKMQTMGWSCNVQSHVSSSGQLSYTVRFTKDKLVSSCRSESIPMAVCAAALGIVDEKYFEYVDDNNPAPSDEKPEAEIINLHKFDQKKTEIKTEEKSETIIDIITDTIDGAKFRALSGGNYDMAKILKLAKRTKRLPDDLEQDFSHQLSRIILDKLNKSGYAIYRKKKDQDNDID